MRNGHSLDDISTIQEHFERRFSSRKGVVGIGIGRNSEHTDYVLHVLVDDANAADKLPKQFESAEVVVDVVGPAAAL